MVHEAVRQSSSEVANGSHSGQASVTEWLLRITEWRAVRVGALDRTGMRLETSSHLPGEPLNLEEAVVPMLFPAEWQQTDRLFRPSIETPLGSFELELRVAGVLASTAVEASQACCGETRLFSWNTQGHSAELFLCSVKPQLPPGMHVTACCAALWRVRAEGGSPAEFAFSCRWSPGSKQERGAPCSGQGLEAVEWTANRTCLTLGTLDAETFASFGRGVEGFPKRWLKERWNVWPEDLELVQYCSDGLLVSPPPIAVGEVVQVQFVAAWSPAPDTQSATWFAVDLPPDQILSSL